MRGVNPEQRFQVIMQALNKETADMLLLTGDLSHHAKSAYLRLSDSLQCLPFPSYWIPGNHDLPEEMSAFSELGYGKKVIQQGNWRVLMLDSSAFPDGRGGGSLSPTELKFLRAELQQAPTELNLLLVLHHNPVSVDSVWQDGIMLGNADQFWSIVTEFEAKIRGIIFGHVHQAWQLQKSSVTLFSSPATAAQFKRGTIRPETEDDPGLSGPAYAVYELYTDGRIRQSITRLPA